ncbi:MAG: flagellar filament capping protein FliD [Planctomycetes bacterium]|nr:flagellar filament capping protein FliD [Planctomycetota bacterium]
MGEIRLPGLATGIDTAALIKQLMIINSRRLATYQVEKTGYETQNTALSELRAKVAAVKSATGTLSDIDDLEVFSVSSSDKTALTLAATSEASPGSHSILINQLATTNTWIQDTSTLDYTTDYVGAGTFIYSYNNKETTITAVADVTTLEDFVNLINQDENNPGVSASLLLQDGKYHLMLSGQETGEDYQIAVNASSTEVLRADSAFTLASDNTQNAGLTTKITELDEFTENAGLQGGAPHEEIQITGTDRYTNAITQFDLPVTSNTTLAHLLDAIEDAFGGNVKATLEEGKIVVTDKASGASSLTVSLAYDAGSGDTALTVPTMTVYKEGAATSESLTSLDSSTFIQTQVAQNSEIKVDGYPAAAAVSEEQTLSVAGNPSGGHYHLTYNGQTTGEILHTDGQVAIQAAIDALSNIEAGDITVSAQANGIDDGDVTFTFSDTLGDVNMILADGSALVGSPSATLSVAETTPGVNSWITRNGNCIADALTGITLNLHDINEVDSGDNPIPIEITVGRNTAAVSQKIKSLVNAYNELMTELESKTEYNTETKKIGILSNDIAVSFIKTQSSDPFIGTVAGFVGTIDTYFQSMDIGLTIDSTGMMEFDTDEFNAAISDDYTNVLELLGATKSGNSSSNIIQFYSADETYTTAGTYDIEVDIDTNAITDVRIKLSTESSFRDNSTWSNDFVTGMAVFDEGSPVYPEHGLQFTVDLNQANGTYTATVNVKQGMAGAFEEYLNEILEADGRLDVSKETLDDRITAMERRIENEEARLTKVETRLINRYARLERTLTMMQQQMGAVSAVSQATFG